MTGRILLVNNSIYNNRFSYAGLEKMFVWLANALAQKDMDVTVCTLFDEKRSPYLIDKVKSIELAFPYYESYKERNLLLFTKVRKALKSTINNRYDIVVNFGDISFFVIILLKLSCKFKLVVSERMDPHFSQSILQSIKRKLFRYADLHVFQTVGARDYFPKIIKEKSVIINNPIVIPEERWDANSCLKRIAFVGRIDYWQKRIDVLIDAFAEVHKQYPEYVLDVYGSGEIERLKQQCSEKHIENCVVVHGSVASINKELCNKEIFVITSDFEGIPNALLEAMALGMPVVSTNCSPGGAALLIEDEKNGLIVDRSNHIVVALAIKKFIDNKQLEIQCATNARNDMKKFDPSIISEQWMNALIKLEKMVKKIDILHINHNSRGTEGLYEAGIIDALEKGNFRQDAFLSSLYPFNYGHRLFFKYAFKIKEKKRSMFVRGLMFFELIFDWLYIYCYILILRPKVVNHSLLSRFMLPERLFIKAICKIAGVKVILTCHDVIPFYNKDKEIEKRRDIMNRVDFLLIHNKSSRSDLVKYFGVPSEKILDHPFPLMELSRLYPAQYSDKDIDFLFTGYVRKSKGIHVLLEAWKEFKDRGNKKMVIAGALSDEDIDLSVYKGLGIEFKLYFLDPAEYCELLKRSKCVILPYLEGTNSAILYSAIAAGCDVIASDIPMFETNELVPKSHLFKSGDSYDLCRLLREYDMQENSVEINKIKYEEEFGRRVVEVYKTLLS